MKRFSRVRQIVPTIVLLSASIAFSHEPLKLHPDNPHYFLFRGRPTIIITSAEHYGAVLNREFNFVKYLDELASQGMNNTRTFSGAYAEPQGAFNIAKNTLAPGPDQLLCPWARSDQPGYSGGGNKFDLTKWDDACFARWKQFLTEAGRRGILVEVNLFCPFYEEPQWKLSPFHPSNNVNGIGQVARTDVYTLDKNGGLLDVQLKMVEKFVHELNGFDNLYYEICNEPYFGSVTLDWQYRIADAITATESKLPNRHLISQNIANATAKVEKPHPSISIFNFHYASPPLAVAQNFALNKVIGDNETGFKGTGNDHYRMEAWQFILAGGSLYNNLDYSFAVGHEDGTFEYPPQQPGGGNRELRRQLKSLREFIEHFDYLKMRPVELDAKLPAKGTIYALAEPLKQYAIYVHNAVGGQIRLQLPKARYYFHDPVGGTLGATREHAGGELLIDVDVPELAIGIQVSSR